MLRMFKIIRPDRPEIEIWQIFDPYVEKGPKTSFDSRYCSPNIMYWQKFLTVSSKIAVSVHAQNTFAHEQPRTLARLWT